METYLRSDSPEDPAITRRIALVGLGPKGLHQLERLLVESAKDCDVSYFIDLYEPHPEPGAGPVYASNQPDWLRANLAARFVDAWSRDALPLDGCRRLAFVEWAREQGKEVLDDDYVPRRLIGEYLQQSLAELLAHCPGNVQLRHVDKRVSTAYRTEHGWRVVCGNGPGAIPSEQLYDELHLAIGHQEVQPTLDQHEYAAHARTSMGRFIDAIYPVNERLGDGAVLPRESVIVRGMGLTAVDAVLAMTEGRGGRFERNASDEVLNYQRSGAEPGRIYLYSRSGRLPFPKLLAATERRFREAIASQVHLPFPAVLDDHTMQGGDATDPVAKIANRIARETVRRFAAVRAARNRPMTTESIYTCYRVLQRLLWSVSAGEDVVTGEARAESLRRAIAVARGERPITLAAIAGLVWHDEYPNIVAQTSFGGLTAYQHKRFAHLARYFERIAFGPPVCNCERLMALIDAGVVSVEAACSPQVRLVGGGFHLSGGNVSELCPVMVRAQIDPPRLSDTRSELLRSLLQRGWIRPHHSEIGIDVTPQGQAIELDGRVAQGLFIFGRPTEGCVLGNDTLSRKLHDTNARHAIDRTESETKDGELYEIDYVSTRQASSVSF